MNKLFPQLRERILYLTELLWKYPPFCYNDYEKELRRINVLFDESALPQIRIPDSDFQTEFLRFCVGIIRIPIAMYAAQNSLSLSVPPTRYRQLRTVAYLCAMAENASDETVLSAVSTALEVTPSVAATLLMEYHTLFPPQALDDETTSVSGGVDPARAYDRYMRWALLRQLMEKILTPREVNLVRSYLGIGQPDKVGMTFQELAVYLNYNGPSGAEKAYKTALQKLRKNLYSGTYGQWLSTQRAIRAAKAESEANSGQYATPQRTWWEEQK